MPEQLIGKRIDRTDDSIFAAGEFGKHSDGVWYASTPNGLLANLSLHDVTEHDDGTITVSPSILARRGAFGKEWHGYLERGVWREC